MRLTKKYDINYTHKDFTKKELDAMYQCVDKDRNRLAMIFWKLGKLEDIEQELGIDLITLFKALDINNSIYVKEGNEIYEFDKFISDIRHVNKYELFVSETGDYECMYLPFKDYGKGWSLDRKELEK